MRVVDSDFLPQIFPRFFILVRLSPLPHKSILVHSAQKNSHNFIVFAEMMQMKKIRQIDIDEHNKLEKIYALIQQDSKNIRLNGLQVPSWMCQKTAIYTRH